MAARFVRIVKFCSETGYSDRAVETKIHRGVWIEGKEYVRAPDNNILIDMEGYNQWAAKQRQEVLDREATA